MMDVLTYLIIAAIIFCVAIVVEIILVKQDAVKNMSASYDPSDIAIAIVVTFVVSVAWILTVPCSILGAAIYGISRLVANWLNE